MSAARLRAQVLPLLAFVLAAVLPVLARASCIPVAQLPARLFLAADRPDVPPGSIHLTFLGHATFLIETAGGATAVTDYNGYIRPDFTPDLVTMNNAHSTHYTDTPDPGIKHVLRGWGPSPEQPARHDIQVGDVRVRNVPTNIRNYMSGGTERHGNSIFVFEIANLCIAHLGHLHHTLTQQQLNEIGRLDAVMVPVDGGVTLDLEGMSEVLAALKAPLMIPMHYFSTYTLRRFLDVLGEKSYEIEMSETPSVVVSKANLPVKPKVLVLPGRAF